MKTVIECQDPKDPGRFVEKCGRWYKYFENGELVASKLTMSEAFDLFYNK